MGPDMGTSPHEMAWITDVYQTLHSTISIIWPIKQYTLPAKVLVYFVMIGKTILQVGPRIAL
jgi:hypothetical protein